MKRLFPIVILTLLGFRIAVAQDTIFTIYKEVYRGKVIEVSTRRVKYIPADSIGGWIYSIKTAIIDSIKYSNGKVDSMEARHRRNLFENIPQLNTWSLDGGGFLYSTISQSYERRLKNGIIGFRIPLYISFKGGGIAGEGLFSPWKGVYNFYKLYNGPINNGGGVATGINVKCYMNKSRIIRAFAGPEAVIGYSTLKGGEGFSENGLYYNNNTRINLGTFAAAGKAGISINPIDRFCATFEGGAGIGDAFGIHNPVGLTGIWQVGLALGTNF